MLDCSGTCVKSEVAGAGLDADSFLLFFLTTASLREWNKTHHVLQVKTRQKSPHLFYLEMGAHFVDFVCFIFSFN